MRIQRALALAFLCSFAVLWLPGAASLSAADSSDPTASSDPPSGRVDEVVTVTANRIEILAERAGSSVSVLEQEEIDALAKSTLADVLRTLPGLEVVRSGPSGQVTSVFIRGGNSSHTLVLLDGMRVNSATTGAFDFADLSADQIARVEVLRGPQSTLYGSEAMAGVVSITTRKGRQGFHLSGLGEVGEDGRYRLRLGIEGGEGVFDYGLTVSDLRTNGFSAASEARGNTEEDVHENTTVVGRFGFALGQEGRLDFTLRQFSGEVEVDGFDFATGGPIDNLLASNERESVTTGLRYHQRLAPRWRQTLTLGMSDDELVGKDPGGFGNFEIDSEVFSLGSQTDFEASKGQTYTFGYAYEEREGGSVGTFAESSLITSFYLQGSWSLGERLFLTAGGRRDEHSEFGGETTYRGTLAWLFPATGARLHGSFGTAFKAPTLNDLFFPGFSNPNLRPETSEGFDLGVELKKMKGRLSLDLTYFRLDFDGLIAFDFATFTPQNIAAARSDGFEFSLGYRPSERWGLNLSHTYNETEDQDSRRQLARRPERRSTLRLDFHPWSQVRANVTLLSIGDRIDSDGSDMDDYERLDVALRYELLESLTAYLRVENLTDEDYEEVNGFTAPGSVAAVGLSFEI